MTIVKKYRIDLLIQKYELFTMKPNESLYCMSGRFSSIVNELKNLCRKFESEDITRKVLRSLTKKWSPKVTVMEESRDLTSLSYQELIGALKDHDLVLHKEEAEPSKIRVWLCKHQQVKRLILILRTRRSCLLDV
ncbi:uncharacterized protein LOC141629968 [Silene latifolia]|uniref:uncharacterized protein LOC141629968 n=1 Tax=Silene latifolia TaxID=37657 RepID=UPI003D77F0B2